MSAYNSASTRQLRSRKGQPIGNAPNRLPAASIGMAYQTLDIIMSEGIITDGPSPATDGDAAMMDVMLAVSRRKDTVPASITDETTPTGDFAPSSEDAAPASILEQTVPGGIRPSTPIDGSISQLSEDTAPASIVEDTTPTDEFAPSNTDKTPASIIKDTVPGGIRPSTPSDGPTVQLSEDAVEAAALVNVIEKTIPSDMEMSIHDEASTHVVILDHVAAKATVDGDTAMVAMDEGTLIPVEKTGDEEPSAVSVSAGNVDDDTIIVEEEDACFELDGEGPQMEMTQSTATGGSMQPIMIEDNDEQIGEAPAYIRDIVRRDVSDGDVESEYSDDNNRPSSPRQFSRSSRLQGRLNQLQDNHVGYTIKVLERLIKQIGSRDNREPKDTDHQGSSTDGYLLSELNATSRTIGSLDWIMADIQKYRTKLSRARRQQKKQRAARRV